MAGAAEAHRPRLGRHRGFNLLDLRGDALLHFVDLGDCRDGVREVNPAREVFFGIRESSVGV